MKKKIAILLFGISKIEYTAKAVQNNSPEQILVKRKIDYEKSYENYNEFIFNYFKEIGYDIDIFYCTNKLSIEDENTLRNKYNPVNFLYLENLNNPDISRNTKLLSCVNLCLDSKITYDLVLITRFDLIFKKNFGESNIDFSKFNLVSILEIPNAICDNFYLMPYTYLKTFQQIIKPFLRYSFHFLKNIFERTYSKENINFILNEFTWISELNFYKIYRDDKQIKEVKNEKKKKRKKEKKKKKKK